MSLRQLRNLSNCIETISILNFDHEESTKSPTQITNTNYSDYILSDADQELLILIKFKCIVSLKSIEIYSLDKDIEGNIMSQPKQVHIYKLKDLSFNFDDLASIKHDKSIKCSSKKLAKGQSVNLQKDSKIVARFNSIECIGIYVSSNQNGTEKTIINSIQLIGYIQHENNKNKYNIPTPNESCQTPNKSCQQESNMDIINSLNLPTPNESWQTRKQQRYKPQKYKPHHLSQQKGDKIVKKGFLFNSNSNYKQMMDYHAIRITLIHGYILGHSNHRIRDQMLNIIGIIDNYIYVYIQLNPAIFHHWQWNQIFPFGTWSKQGNEDFSLNIKNDFTFQMNYNYYEHDSIIYGLSGTFHVIDSNSIQLIFDDKEISKINKVSSSNMNDSFNILSDYCIVQLSSTNDKCKCYNPKTKYVWQSFDKNKTNYDL